MHINKISRRGRAILEAAIRLFSLFFWLLVLLGFDGGKGAAVTVIAIVIHELGHEAALFIIGAGTRLPLPGLHGFRIKPRRILSYKEEIFVCAAGPAANLIAALLLIPFPAEWMRLLLATNLLTAISNLLPVRGYDGYKILRDTAMLAGSERGVRLTDVLSFATASAAVLLSLYAIYALDAGYWIFGVFFIFLLGEVKNSLN